MTIRLTSDEAWEAVDAAHTGILTTLRRDGRPIALPVWFVVDDHTVAMSTPVEIVENAAAKSRIDAALNEKYAAFRPPGAGLSKAAQAYYASQVFLRFVPEGRILTWDNARLAMK